MRIAVDCDDVILDLCGGLCRSLKLEKGIDLTPEQVANTPEGRATFEKYQLGGYADLDSWPARRDWVWATFPPIEGAIGGIEELRRQGHYLELVTKKPEWAEWVTWKWLGRWRPAVNSVIILPLDGNKAEVSNADILIDDTVSTCEQWAATGRKAILFGQPWNADFSGKFNGTIRVEGWQEVVAMVGNAVAYAG